MAQCELFIPSAPHGSCHVSISWGSIWHPHDRVIWHPHNHAMCHPTPNASKNVKFRLSRNLTKFDELTKFRETNSTVEVRFVIRDLKNFRFSIKIIVLPFLRKTKFFLGFIE